LKKICGHRLKQCATRLFDFVCLPAIFGTWLLFTGPPRMNNRKPFGLAKVLRLVCDTAALRKRGFRLLLQSYSRELPPGH
jgi:hypothetical protein